MRTSAIRILYRILPESYLIYPIIIGISIMLFYQYTPRDAWGINNFRLFLDAVTGMNTQRLKGVCKWLDVSEKTLQRWMAGTSPVPRAVCYALFHESKYGRGLAETTAYNDRALLLSQIDLLQMRIRALEADNDALRNAADAAAPYLAVNDANYGARPQARRPHPFTTFKARRVRHRRA
jgi:hypothetical protein